MLNPKYTFSITNAQNVLQILLYVSLISLTIYDFKGTLLNTDELLKVIKNKEIHKVSFKFLS